MQKERMEELLLEGKISFSSEEEEEKEREYNYENNQTIKDNKGFNITFKIVPKSNEGLVTKFGKIQIISSPPYFKKLDEKEIIRRIEELNDKLPKKKKKKNEDPSYEGNDIDRMDEIDFLRYGSMTRKKYIPSKKELEEEEQRKKEEEYERKVDSANFIYFNGKKYPTIWREGNRYLIDGEEENKWIYVGVGAAGKKWGDYKDYLELQNIKLEDDKYFKELYIAFKKEEIRDRIDLLETNEKFLTEDKRKELEELREEEKNVIFDYKPKKVDEKPPINLLMKKHKKELLEMARNLNLKNFSKKTKPELIKLIEKAPPKTNESPKKTEREKIREAAKKAGVKYIGNKSKAELKRLMENPPPQKRTKKIIMKEAKELGIKDVKNKTKEELEKEINIKMFPSAGSKMIQIKKVV